jgi:hypothetical protein
MRRRVLATTDIREIELNIPPGHQHLRATLHLQSGEELVLQEATVAGLVRAFMAVKTHPLNFGVRLVGRDVAQSELKPGFAAWQLLEEK